MKRTGAALLLVLASCTMPNPDFDPNWHANQAVVDLSSGWSIDLAAAPDSASPSDLLPPYLGQVGSRCDGGSALLGCVNGLACVVIRGACVEHANCCQDPMTPPGQSTTAGCMQGRCCSIQRGEPCFADVDCCFTRGDGAKPHCANGLCQY